MKNFLFTLTALMLFTIVVKTQSSFSYRVYVIPIGGKTLNKTYKSVQELQTDQTAQDLQIGYMQGQEFIFTPDEKKHKAFFAQKIGANDRHKHFLFEAWDGGAAKEIEKAMNFQLEQPAQIQKEKHITSATQSQRKKGFEEELVQELMKDGIIKKENRKLSITLTKSAFIVNSAKQPQRILTKYISLAQSLRGEPVSENYRFEYTSEVSN